MIHQSTSQLAAAVYNGNVEEGQKIIQKLNESLSKMDQLCVMRNFARMLLHIYKKYPSLDDIELNVRHNVNLWEAYVSSGSLSDKEQEQLNDLILGADPDAYRDDPFEGALNSDGQMRDAFNVFPIDTQDQDHTSKGSRSLVVTRSMVDQARQKEDPERALAQEAFGKKWFDTLKELGVETAADQRSVDVQTLTLFMSTNLEPIVVSLDVTALDKLTRLVQVAKTHKVNISMPVPIEVLDPEEPSPLGRCEAYLVVGANYDFHENNAMVGFCAQEADLHGEELNSITVSLKRLREALHEGQTQLFFSYNGEIDENEFYQREGRRPHPRPAG